MVVEVRQATRQDGALSFAITEDAIRAYVESTWGPWDAVKQHRAHAESFVPVNHWIVLAEDKAVGVVAAELQPSHVQLAKLYLRTAARGRGIGALVLSSLLRAAAERSQPIRLRVLAVNVRAQAFYLLHGFRESARTAERVFMEANPYLSNERTSLKSFAGRLPLPISNVR